MASPFHNAILSCLCCTEQPTDHHDHPHESTPLIITEKPPLQPHPPRLDLLTSHLESPTTIEIQTSQILSLLLAAHSSGPTLDADINSVVSTTSWTEILAKRVLEGLKRILDPNNNKDKRWGEALTAAYEDAVEAAEDIFRDLVQFVRDHPTETEIFVSVLLSLFAYGVLVRLAPRVLILLGFGVDGPVEGEFKHLTLHMKE